MAESTNIGTIPPIGSSQIGMNQNPKNMNKPDVSLFDNAPNDVTFGSFFGKIFIGALIGICVAALLFATLSVIGSLGSSANDGSANSMLGALLPVIGFVVSFVGNLALALLYNIFFSKKYYNFGKMFGLIFMSSIIILLFFFVVYFLYNDIRSLYMILGFQIMFGLYVCLNLIDFLSQPNYSASSLMGNTLGFILSIVVYLGIIKNVDINWILLFTIAATALSYAITNLGSCIWDGIYYKFYEWGNNPFYLPSLNELREERQKEETRKAKDEEEVNVEI